MLARGSELRLTAERKQKLTIDLGEVCPAVPRHISSEKIGSLIDSVVTSELWSVGVENNLVLSGHINSDSIVGEAVL
jgi:hypothetical protein